jgi:signal transduction histidine kinase
MQDGFVLASREAALLLGGALALVGSAFVASKVLRALRHGFSVRLQLFFAILGPSLVATAMVGAWAVDRVQSRASEIVADDQSSELALTALVRDFGPKSTILFVLLGAAAAGAAFALGRGIGGPLEELSRAAEAVARGERHAVLPPPVGREVRRLTDAFEKMRTSLEDRHAIEGFVADLSHELKNPVAAIRAATEVLQEGAAEDPHDRARFIGRIDEACRRLEVLLHDLLGLAKLEARGVEPVARRFAFEAVVAQAVAVAQEAFDDEQGPNIVVNLEPAPVRGDAKWVRRAVDNLLSNALRYSPPGGTVTITLERNGEHAVLRVLDEGPGVAPALRPRLFERFVTDRSRPGGTGLGLAIVRTVAEQHGGEARLVEVASGACFEFSLRGAGHRD